jgi:class 3 adenylate cyclase/CHASE2 domain-containing sensor protein/predicted Zn-dependent protease
MLRRGPRAKRLSIALAVGVLGALVAATEPGFLVEESVGLEQLFELRGPLPPPAEVAVVRLDRGTLRSLQALPQQPAEWPPQLRTCAADLGGLPQISRLEDLPRAIYACAVDALTAAGAATVVFDIAFRPDPRRDQGTPALAAAMQRHGHVVLAARADMEPLGLGRTVSGSVLRLTQGVVQPPHPSLAAAAAGVATFTLPVGETTLVHQAWVRNRSFADPVQLPLRALEVRAIDAMRRLAGPSDPAAPEMPDERRARLVDRLLALPEPALDLVAGEDSRLLRAVRRAHAQPDYVYINYLGPPGTVPSLSLAELLMSPPGRLPLGVAGRTVFLGRMELDVADKVDHFPTVFRRTDGIDLSGVEIAATTFTNLLDGRPLRGLPEGLRLLLIFGLGTGLTLLACHGTVWRGLVLAALAGALYGVGAFIAFAWADLWLPIIIPAVLLITAILLGQIVHYDGLARWFGTYVPARLARHLLRGEDAWARAQTVELTAMFTDLAGSSRLAEELGPARMAELINEHFEMLNGFIEADGGMRSQVMGDGCLAFWGAPDPMADHAARGCRTALAIADAVAADNRRRRLHGEPVLRLRIGLNTGLATAGNVGGRGQSTYTLTGEAVNVAARIERKAKALCTDLPEVAILVSEATASAAGDGFSFADLGHHIIPGHSRSVRIFRLLGRKVTTQLPRVAALLLGCMLLPAVAEAACPAGPPVGRLEALSHEVSVDGVTVDEHSLPRELCAGTVVRTGPASRATVYLLAADSRFQLDQSSETLLQPPPSPESGLVDLFRGALFMLSEVRRSLGVRTAYATANIEGTEVLVQADGPVVVTVIDGAVSVTGGRRGTPPGLPSRAVGNNEQVVVHPEGAEPIRLLTPADAGAYALLRKAAARQLAWTLYYPPILGDRPRAGSPLLREAARLLQAGRAEEAEASLSEIADGSADAPIRDALRAVIAVVQGDPERGRQLADAAARRAPGAAAPLLARSYAEQAMLNLEAARRSARHATDAEPDHPIAWARRAELELSFGEIRAAREAAERAASLAPTALAQTVQGFAALASFDTEAAQQSFRNALAQDSQQPLAHLGLGLALIRTNALAEGRQQIEIATALDPSRSLLRSYLGKAYFEEHRDPEAGKQLAIAKALDPNDPTPWLYDAIRKQLDNRPVEALHDIEESIALNDDRAPFRSRLLLDEDRAVRDVSLGRIYEDLGFERLGQNAAAEALAADPASSSAHRFLSDLRAGVPQLEVARASELLQAQLLSPPTGNPVQPSLPFTDLDIVERGGPMRVTFDEFTPLFDRNGLRLTGTGLVGNDSTWADEVAASGLFGRTAFSAGQFHYETDGFRPNNELQHDIYDLFGQVQLTDRLGVQAEYRHRRTSHGDRALNFDPDLFSDTFEERVRQDIARLGAHLELAPGHDLIASLLYSDRDEREQQSTALPTPFGEVVDSTRDTRNSDGLQAEAQYLLRSDAWRLVAGGGFYDIDRRFRTEADSDPCPIGDCALDSTSHSTAKAESLYSYAYGELPANATWTVGVGYEHYEEQAFDLSTATPKLGLSWRPLDWVTLRGAAFRSVKRAVTVNQTIEPTQIAGFNQFYDDVNGTSSDQYGLGIDLRLSRRLWATAEVTRRDSAPPLFEGDTAKVGDREDLWYGGALYWTPTDELAMSGGAWGYQFRQLAKDAGANPTRIDQLTLPLDVRYFHPNGLSVLGGATYLYQSVARDNLDSSKAEGHNHAWLFNAAVGWRLPHRRGTISIEIDNIFDENFEYQDQNFRSSELQASPFLPSRTFIARATLSF